MLKKNHYMSLSGNLQITDVCIQFELIYFLYSVKDCSHTEKKCDMHTKQLNT